MEYQRLNLEEELKQEIILKGKVKLVKLFSMKDNFSRNTTKEYSYYSDLFYLNKEFLYIYQVISNWNPEDNHSSFTSNEFEINNDQLKTIKSIKTNTDFNIKILLVENSIHQKYVNKRSWIPLKLSESSSKNISQIIQFVKDKYTEYGIIKLFNACPFSAKPAGFNIIHLTNNTNQKELLITEMLTVYAGDQLSKLFPIRKSELVLEYFKQILLAANFLQAYRIEHNDIKPENILVEFFEDIAIIKLIDFDIGANQPQEITINKGIGSKSFTPGYVAPEIITIVNSNLDEVTKVKKLHELNPWKSHAYSIGVLMLKMIGFTPDQFPFNNFDSMKFSPKTHKIIFDKLDEFNAKQNDQLLKNIIQIISKCIFFFPDIRASAKEILEMIENLPSKDYYFIEKNWKEIISKRVLNKKNMIVKIEELKNEINCFPLQQTKIMEEKKSLISFLQQYFPNANVSISNYLPTQVKELLDKMKSEFESQAQKVNSETLILNERLQNNENEKVDLIDSINSLKNQLQSKNADITKLQDDNKAKDKIINDLRNDLINIRKEYEELKKSTNNRNSKIDLNDMEIAKYRNEEIKLKNLLAQKETEIEKLASLKKELQLLKENKESSNNSAIQLKKAIEEVNNLNVDKVKAFQLLEESLKENGYAFRDKIIE